jgi:hypothetical protein
MRSRLVVLALALHLAGCEVADVNQAVLIVVPATIPSIESGTLRVSLYRYDPFLADAPATRVDHSVIPFSHRTGRSTSAQVWVRGSGARGERFYLAVEGCAQTSDGEMAVLWDGLMVELPSHVVMRSRETPPPCAQVEG